MQPQLLQVEFLRAAIRLTTPVALAALGAVLTGRTGVINFALEGMMLLGCFLAALVSHYTANSYLGVLAGVLSGVALAGLFAFLYTRCNVDLVVLGIAVNLLVAETTVFFLQKLFNNAGSIVSTRIKLLPSFNLPLIERIPVIGGILSGFNAIVYFTWLAVAGCYVLLYHTPLGRHIRATGENMQAARTAGVRVERIQVIALLMSGGLCGLGGAYLSVGHLAMFSAGMTSGRGFWGLVASLFANRHPVGAFATSLFFGAADALAMRLQGLGKLPPEFVLMLPHIVTLIVYSLVGIRSHVAQDLVRRRFRAEVVKPGKDGQAA